MKKYLIIKADTNDADYVQEKNLVSDSQLKKLEPIIKAIKACKEHHNWPNHDGSDKTIEETYEGILTEEQIEFMQEFVPSGGDYGVHSIESIELLEVSKEKTLL